MTRRRLVWSVAGSALGLAVLVLWWLWPAPPTGPVVASRPTSPSPTPTVARVAPSPLAGLDLDAPPEPDPVVETDEEPEPLRSWCAVMGLRGVDRVSATARAAGAVLQLEVEPVPGGVELLVPPDLRRQLADRAHAPVGEIIDLSLTVSGLGVLNGALTGETATLCSVQALRKDAFVEGSVRTTRGLRRGRVRVEGCGASALVDGNGRFRLTVRMGEEERTCDLRAKRQDGAFLMRGDPVAVTLRPGSVSKATLRLTDRVAGGVGVRAGRHPHGVVLAKVLDDSPAFDAGLREGDVVVAVDGAPTVDMSLRAFVDEAVGPQGTEVVYTVLRDGEEVDVPMVREGRASGG